MVSFDLFGPLSNSVIPFSAGSVVTNMIGNNLRSFEWSGLAAASDVKLTGQRPGWQALSPVVGCPALGFCARQVSGQFEGWRGF